MGENMKNNTKNKITDLNDHLFLQLERLNDEALKGDELKEEIARAKVVSAVSSQIIQGARATIEAMRVVHEGLVKHPPRMLGVSGYDEKA